MQICINNVKYEFESGSSLDGVLESLGLKAKKGIAVSVNKRIIQRSSWEHEQMKDSDEIVIIEASQGG
ncbi:MAG: sulfur carrier protein ThiS [Bacteroidia bacterium]